MKKSDSKYIDEKIKFIEDYLGHGLLSYQKELIRFTLMKDKNRTIDFGFPKHKTYSKLLSLLYKSINNK